MKKELTKEQMMVNNLYSDLYNFFSEYKNDTLCDEVFFNYFSDILMSANVESKIIVNVLEKIPHYVAKKLALDIKINEGW